jgi:hypothetical protein
MQYIITEDKKTLEEWQAKVDIEAGYPERIDDVEYVGTGIHAPRELGLALHFAEITTDKTGTKHAIPLSDKTEIPKDSVVADKLPDDWSQTATDLEELP